MAGIKSSGLTGEHNPMITVKYTWNSLLIIKEPLLAIAGWFVFFFVILVIARLDFSIKEKNEWFMKKLENLENFSVIH